MPPPINFPVVGLVNLLAPTPTAQFGNDIDAIKSAPPGGGGGGATEGPFDLSFTAGGSPGDLTPSMRPGTINSVIPSNYLSIPDFSDTGTFYFILSVTTLNGGVVSCTVALAGSPPAGIPVTAGTPPTSFDYLLGVVQDGVWFRTAPTGSLTAVPEDAFHAAIVGPAPGTLPYDIYYTWAVT